MDNPLHIKNGLDLILEYHNAFSDDICDEMVERFELDSRKETGLSGLAGRDYTGPRNKISLDLEISKIEGWEDMDDRIYNILTPYISSYVNILSDYFYCNGLTYIKDLGYQIQRTDPGGYFNWHNDYDNKPLIDQYIEHNDGRPLICTRERIATYILYLNDRLEYGIDDGTTEFRFGNDHKFVTAEKGKLIMFPANPLYPHRGVPLQNGVKYLMTGWVTRDQLYEVAIDDGDYEERSQRYSPPEGFIKFGGRGSWTGVT